MRKLSRVELLGSQDLKLLQSLAGVLQQKISTRAVFKETPTSCVSTERLWNVELDKIMSIFAVKVAEAVDATPVDWNSGELIEYQMRSLMQNNCAVFITRHQSLKGCQYFLFAAAASEPEANERGSSLISRRLLYRGLQSLFLTKRKEFWLCANGRFRMRSGMRKELWICANAETF